MFVLIVLFDQMISQSMNYLYEKTYVGQSGGKINHLLKDFKYISVLSIGNSRCAHHIIPNKINENAYNLSHNGMSLVFHTGLIDQLIMNENIKIDTLLLHIEMHEVFGEQFGLNKDVQHLKYYYDQNNWINSRIKELSRFENLKYLFASYKWNGKVLNIINNRIKSNNQALLNDGYVPKLTTSRDSINVLWTYNKGLENDTSILKSGINTDFIRYVEHIKELCDRNSIKLICFTSPVYNPLNNTVNRDVELEDYFKSKDISYFNYFHLYDSAKELRSVWVWNDNYHLNEDGAAIFTEIIRNDLNDL